MQIGIGHGANIIWHVTVHPAGLCQFEAILTIMLGELINGPEQVANCGIERDDMIDSSHRPRLYMRVWIDIDRFFIHIY